MPKETFKNLAPERQKLIINAALEEFAGHPYEQASLSRIVKKCGIAKGSMYQYFDDKLGLYRYIVELAYEEKKNYVNKAFSREGDIFDILEEYYRQSYVFSRDFPLLHQVANRFWDSRANVLHEHLERGKVSRAQDFNHFLRHAVKSGTVNPMLDPDAVFFVYHAVGKSLIEHFGEEENGDLFKAVLDVLRHGLQIREEDKNDQA
ncbi:MAG: TetR/AcrR family transcriptional regulator [Bacillota bacterium]|nr:TetR/AcrR family transcriptional regulator [Bacillota bacterium]